MPDKSEYVGVQERQEVRDARNAARWSDELPGMPNVLPDTAAVCDSCMAGRMTKSQRAIASEFAWGAAAVFGTTEVAWVSGMVFIYFFLDWGLSPVEL